MKDALFSNLKYSGSQTRPECIKYDKKKIHASIHKQFD